MDRLNLLHKFLLIAILALYVVNQTVLSRIQQDLHEALPELRIKNEVLRQGTGEEAQVLVTLHDGRIKAGFISQVNENGFTFIDASTGKKDELTYRLVKDVRQADSTDAGLSQAVFRWPHVLESIAMASR
ncbi:MAG: hypothetical protein ABL984_01595 [Pyrinomonadaceae bacterium]